MKDYSLYFWIMSAILIILITINFFNKQTEKSIIDRNKAETEYFKAVTESIKKK